MQMAGQGRCIRAKHLREAIEQSPSLLQSFLRYAHTFLNQATRTAVANGRSKIEERLARWLLMAHDRADGPELPLTHEFLAMMLGVRRLGVTVAIQELEREGLVERKRSRIDRAGLMKLSNGTYVPADG
jgi:CRP-like cAMP-binding protein